VAEIIGIWVEIRRLAASQWGHVTRTELLTFGVPASTIETWVARGRLIPAHAGVYALGYPRVEPEALAMAAVLAGGVGAVLSHDSAAALWGLRRWPDPPEITTARRVERGGVMAHRSRTLTDGDVTVQRGIPTTTAARTLRDIRSRIRTRRRFDQLVNQARLAHHLDSDAAFLLLGHRHNATRSQGEDTFLQLCIRHHLPIPVLNTSVLGYEVDAVFLDHMVIVEVDHYDTHGDPATFDDDRIRDADLAAAGYLVIRVTEERLLRNPKAEAARLRTIFKRRRGAS
jgi:very-short-patch-repair endonuclease